MCDELQANTGNLLNLLMATPNGRDEAGTSRDCYLFNPTLTSQQYLNNFRFLGLLMGMAIRSGSPLSLSLAEPMWKLLAGSSLTVGFLSYSRDLTTNSEITNLKLTNEN